MTASGYIAAKRESGNFVICFTIAGQKYYAFCDLNDAREVITGRKAYCSIRRS
jgi:hypothetical protein